jgi:hypothetical protein
VSDRDARRDAPEEPETVAGTKGTAAEIDVTFDPRARTTVAGFLVGPVIGVVHFLVVYLVVEAGCSGDGPGLDLLDPPVPTVVTVVATVLAALACAAAAGWTWWRWRTGLRTEGSSEQLVDHAPLAFVGFLLSVLALITVLLVGLPALVLEAC